MPPLLPRLARAVASPQSPSLLAYHARRLLFFESARCPSPRRQQGACVRGRDTPEGVRVRWVHGLLIRASRRKMCVVYIHHTGQRPAGSDKTLTAAAPEPIAENAHTHPTLSGRLRVPQGAKNGTTTELGLPCLPCAPISRHICKVPLASPFLGNPKNQKKLLFNMAG